MNKLLNYKIIFTMTLLSLDQTLHSMATNLSRAYRNATPTIQRGARNLSTNALKDYLKRVSSQTAESGAIRSALENQVARSTAPVPDTSTWSGAIRNQFSGYSRLNALNDLRADLKTIAVAENMTAEKIADLNRIVESDFKRPLLYWRINEGPNFMKGIIPYSTIAAMGSLLIEHPELAILAAAAAGGAQRNKPILNTGFKLESLNGQAALPEELALFAKKNPEFINRLNDIAQSETLYAQAEKEAERLKDIKRYGKVLAAGGAVLGLGGVLAHSNAKTQAEIERKEKIEALKAQLIDAQVRYDEAYAKAKSIYDKVKSEYDALVKKLNYEIEANKPWSFFHTTTGLQYLHDKALKRRDEILDEPKKRLEGLNPSRNKEVRKFEEEIKDIERQIWRLEYVIKR